MAQITIDKKRIIIIIVVIFVLILFISIKHYDRTDETEDIPESIVELEEEETVESVTLPEGSRPTIVYVDIKGAVIKPGVYKLEDEKRVLDAIQLAGGFKNDADQTKINLAARVTDEMVLYIPTIGEVLQNEFQNETGLPTNEIDEGKININTATSAELESLPGIGAAKAASIITFREQNGPFKENRDLVNVSGIGDKSFEQLKDKITVR